MKTRNEQRRERRLELLTLCGVVLLCGLLVAFGWALHGALDAVAW